MTPTTYEHKQGDTFNWAGTLQVTENGAPVVDLPAVASQVRTFPGGALVASLTVTLGVPDVNGVPIALREDDTTSWPPGRLCLDVQLTFAGNVVRSSDTVVFTCVKDVTR